MVWVWVVLKGAMMVVSSLGVSSFESCEVEVEVVDDVVGELVFDILLMLIECRSGRIIVRDVRRQFSFGRVGDEKDRGV